MPRRLDQRSAQAADYRRWYWTSRWKARSKAQLTAEPLCRMCRAMGHTTPATVADHVIEHKGNATLFWEGELQSLCQTHHSATKAREERAGTAIGAYADGWPLGSAEEAARSRRLR